MSGTPTPCWLPGKTKLTAMKSFIISVSLLFTTVFLSLSLSAQIVQEGTKPMSKGAQNCFFLELPTADNKLATDTWQNFIKSYRGKTKYNRKTKEYFTDDATIRGMSDNTVDVYARFDPAQITVWFDLGGAYLSSAMHPDRYPEVERMLSAYYLELSKEVAKADLKAKEDELKSLERDLKKLEDDNKSLNDNIKKARETIAKAEKDIESNQQLQTAKQQAIKEKQKDVEGAKSHLNNLGRKN